MVVVWMQACVWRWMGERTGGRGLARPEVVTSPLIDFSRAAALTRLNWAPNPKEPPLEWALVGVRYVPAAHRTVAPSPRQMRSHAGTPVGVYKMGYI